MTYIPVCVACEEEWREQCSICEGCQCCCYCCECFDFVDVYPLVKVAVVKSEYL